MKGSVDNIGSKDHKGRRKSKKKPGSRGGIED